MMPVHLVYLAELQHVVMLVDEVSHDSLVIRPAWAQSLEDRAWVWLVHDALAGLRDPLDTVALLAITLPADHGRVLHY